MLAKSIPWNELGCAEPIISFNGTTGRHDILAYKPDIIITDINMPGIDGLKMIEICQNNLPNSKVIFISAYDYFSYAARAIKLHAFGYLLKPFANEDLIKLIKDAVYNHLSYIYPDKMPKDFNKNNLKSMATVNSLLVDKMLEFINAHLSEHISLEKLAEHFGISVSYINPLIKKYTGKNYSQWLHDLKMKMAKKLLQDPRYRIDEISLLVGYKNYVSFYKVFTKHEGVSPSNYREQYVGREFHINEDTN